MLLVKNSHGRQKFARVAEALLRLKHIRSGILSRIPKNMTIVYYFPTLICEITLVFISTMVHSGLHFKSARKK